MKPTDIIFNAALVGITKVVWDPVKAAESRYTGSTAPLPKFTFYKRYQINNKCMGMPSLQRQLYDYRCNNGIIHCLLFVFDHMVNK